MILKKLLLAALLLIGSKAYLQIQINEYSASNLRDFRDEYDKSEDWIELYNYSDMEIDLGGYYLSDRENNPLKWQIPAGTIINAGSYVVFYTSGRNIGRHTNFKLSQTDNKEAIVLSDPQGTVIEATKLRKTQLSHSIGKLNDGSDWKIFTQPTPGETNIGSPHYNAYCPTPSLTKAAGFYTDAVYTSALGNPAFTLRYTLDGSQPDVTSPEYTDSLLISATSVVKVRNFSDDTLWLPGLIDFKTYFINEPASTLPIFSVASEQAILLAEGDRELQPISSIECFDKDGKLYAVSYGELDSHGQDSWVNDQRSLDWISRDEMGYSPAIKAKLFNSSDRDDFQRIIFRASGDDNYPAINDNDHKGSTHVRDEYVQTLAQHGKMNLDLRSVERCILYLNGQYWGVYTIREKPDDHDYTNFRYNQDKYDIQFLKTWGQSWAEYGGDKAFRDWEALRDWILNNDMSNPQNYDSLTAQYDVLSIMDYMLINLSVVSSDWMNYNVGWWRGLNPEGEHKKWGYMLWDNDATFDYYINYSGVPNTNPDAQACDIEDIASYMDEFFPADTTEFITEADSFFWMGEWIYFPADTFEIYPDLGKHEKIFLKLLDENPTFRNLYFARYADHINNVFSCENMNRVLDSLLAIIEPEMPRHIERWGRSLTEWKANVARLKNYVNQRCALIDDGMVNCYEITGPHQITVVTEPAIPATIDFNTLSKVSLPYNAHYFGNMKNSVTAQNYDGFVFMGWQSSNGNITIDNPTALSTTFTIDNSDTLIAVYQDLTATNDINSYDLGIYPNPSSNLIYATVEGNVKQYALYNSAGARMENYRGQINPGQLQIDISAMTPGLYVLEVTTEARTSRNKFMIIK